MAVNEDLDDNPEVINEDPYGKGWIVKVKPRNMDEVNSLLSAADYQNIII
ncbi:MAG: glycine cleavage system protein H [Chitinophagales bacterium]